jgi:NAD(P)-dependent dehydrogenase (short-subunit alcohol dehydrogenase family)
MGKLEGKIALITGGNSGIGFATAQQFVKEGAAVFITGRSQTKLDEAVKRVGSNVTGVQGDVSKLEDLDRLFAQIKKEKAGYCFCECGNRKVRADRLDRRGALRQYLRWQRKRDAVHGTEGAAVDAGWSVDYS